MLHTQFKQSQASQFQGHDFKIERASENLWSFVLIKGPQNPTYFNFLSFLFSKSFVFIQCSLSNFFGCFKQFANFLWSVSNLMFKPFIKSLMQRLKCHPQKSIWFFVKTAQSFGFESILFFYHVFDANFILRSLKHTLFIFYNSDLFKLLGTNSTPYDPCLTSSRLSFEVVNSRY